MFTMAGRWGGGVITAWTEMAKLSYRFKSVNVGNGLFGHSKIWLPWQPLPSKVFLSWLISSSDVMYILLEQYHRFIPAHECVTLGILETAITDNIISDRRIPNCGVAIN